jgi:Na+/melibiose symporter-like transporter
MEELKKPLISNTSHLKEAIKSLMKSSKYLWLILSIKFTSFAAFSILASCSTLYLTIQLKFTEKETGLIFASLGLIITFYSIIFSNLAKYIGIRQTFILGNIMGCIGYALVLLFKDRYIQYVSICVFLLFAISINLNNTKLGVKYYTYPKSRSIAYTIYYLVFFTASGVVAIIIEIMFNLYEKEAFLFQVIFSIGLFLYITTLFLSFFLKEIDLENEDYDSIHLMPISQVMKLKSFWKLLGFVSLIIISKSVYFHLSGTLPVYMKNNIEGGNHFGLMMGLHQVILLIATPLFTCMVFYFDKYTILMIGTLITSLSPMALYYENSFLGVVLFTVFVSIGEGIYAPRVTDYTIEISPLGAEAIFLGIAAGPNSLSLIVTGISSGVLNDIYCYDKATCQTIWFWISVYATSSVIFMFLFRKVLEVKTKQL